MNIKNIPLFAIVALIFALISCSPDPYVASKKVYRQQLKSYIKTLKLMEPVKSDSLLDAQWISTVNFNLRKPNYVIIHHTAQDSLKQTLKTFTISRTQVSAHYVIGRDGKVVQMLSDYLRAWHSGVGRWGNCSDINSTSIGIELDNNGKEPFSDVQINRLITLLGKLKKTYNIPAANFIGHSDITPGRKVDPSVLFPWKKLADRGFGLWYTLPLDTVPTNFNTHDALRIIGYDTKDLNAAVIAFKRHFIPTDLSPAVYDSTKMILNNLYRKCL